MYSAPRAKEEIVNPASFVDPSTPSEPLRFTLSVPGLLIQLPSQILPCLRGWVADSRHVRASASLAFRSPASLGGGADVSGALLVNIIAWSRQPGRPSPAGSSTQIRLKRSIAPVARLLREGHASMAHHLPGRAPSGGRGLRPHPAAVSPLRLSKICRVLHRRRGRLSLTARRTRSPMGGKPCGTLNVA